MLIHLTLKIPSMTSFGLFFSNWPWKWPLWFYLSFSLIKCALDSENVLLWPLLTSCDFFLSHILICFIIISTTITYIHLIFLHFYQSPHCWSPLLLCLRSIIYLFHMTSFDLMWLFSITYTLSSLWKNLLALSGIEPEPFMCILA